jgi:phosphopantetheinyl transferase
MTPFDGQKGEVLSTEDRSFQEMTASVPVVVHWRFEIESNLDPSKTNQVAATRLTPRERTVLESFPFEKRRLEWLLGRSIAKRLLCDRLREHLKSDVPPHAIEVWRHPNGAPLVLSADDRLPWPSGTPLPLELSLSHSHGAVLCAVLWHQRQSAAVPRLGVDVERIDLRSPDLFRDYFTESEHRYTEDGPGRDQRSTLIWSGKESTLKALGKGLTVDTRAVTCLPMPNASVSADSLELVPPAGWQPLSISVPRWSPTVSRSAGYWRTEAGFVLTVVVTWVCIEAEAQVVG